MSRLEAYNSALTRLGEPLMQSPTDSGNNCDLVRYWYPITRDEILRGSRFSFSVRQLALAPLNQPMVSQEWAYHFNKPADCLKVMHCEDASGYKVPHEFLGKYLYADTDTVILTYVSNDESIIGVDDVLIPSEIQLLIGCRMAAVMAFKVNGDKQLKQMLDAEFSDMLRIARNNHSTENDPSAMSGDVWLVSRLGASSDIDQLRTRPLEGVPPEGI